MVEAADEDTARCGLAGGGFGERTTLSHGRSRVATMLQPDA